MTATIDLDADYVPSETEPFMNPRQREYFRRVLDDWKNEILTASQETVLNLQQDTRSVPDISDRATEETDRALELRTRDRQRKLISKIDSALRRLEKDEYGYCEATGEPIGVRRLMARPTATLSVEAQEMHERREKVYRDD